MSAIGTIGDLGTGEDVALLEKLVKDPEERVRRVAKYHLKRLRKKHSK